MSTRSPSEVLPRFVLLLLICWRGKLKNILTRPPCPPLPKGGMRAREGVKSLPRQRFGLVWNASFPPAGRLNTSGSAMRKKSQNFGVLSENGPNTAGSRSSPTYRKRSLACAGLNTDRCVPRKITGPARRVPRKNHKILEFLGKTAGIRPVRSGV